MIDAKPETVAPMLAIQAWKHREFVKVQAAIIRAALSLDLVCASDIAEDVVDEASRQGVKSNGWNTLRALEIIERVPLSLTLPMLGVFGGRKMNENKSAKGRWVAVYTLKSRALALAWLERNGQPLPDQPQRPMKQQELL